MSEKKRINTPPVIRVFLSSTFADMEHERSYFNEVLAPKLGRICSDRGVSFFNVDLRWGITEEDQISGQVLPICLGEIDKCRPYFIGIIGNRYGSLMETVSENISASIPWLEGKEGISITELEMLYAVLDHEKEDPAINSAFYLRSDRLSRELYPDLVSENGTSLGKLEKLKSVIRADSGVLCSDYDTIEEFGEKVMRDLLFWLDENFPESGDIGEIRREWYNGEKLRGHIEDSSMNSFLDAYIQSSNRSLLIYGDGARGKTAALTAWEPKEAKKILINCASDEAYSDWLAVVSRIFTELCEFLPEESEKRLREIVNVINKDRNGRMPGSLAREKFRSTVLVCLRAIEPKCRVAIVINDLNILSDETGRLLSWLPADGGEMINFICTTNDGEMVETADVIGWNVKEMPLFTRERARELVNNSLRVYGKNLTSSQFEALMSSTAASYPGQLRFVISFLLNHGRFNNLDKLSSDISSIEKVHGIYRYVYDYLTAPLSDREASAALDVLGFLRASDIALSESDCFTIAQSECEISPIEWANICRIFEQFDLIHGDYWYIRDEETEKFIDELIPDEKMKELCEVLARHIYGKHLAEVKKGAEANTRETAAYAKQVIKCLRASQNRTSLEKTLCDMAVIASLIDSEPSVLRSAWLELFIETDLPIADIMIELVKKAAEITKPLAVKICKMIHSLDFFNLHEKACALIDVPVAETVDDIVWAEKLTADGVSIYQNLNNKKNQRQFREICDETAELLKSPVDRFNETELCKILFFKGDAEENLGLYEAALATANRYYKAALQAGYTVDVHNALRVRASVLYHLGRQNEALSIITKTGKMVYDAGKTHDYLGTLNLAAMCSYIKERYDESIEIFDRLMSYWLKLDNQREFGNAMLNKCNALYLSGKKQEALDVSERFYESVKNNSSMLSCAVSVAGNIGVYATELKLYEKAEMYLLESLEKAKRLGSERTLLNVYVSLANLYRETDSLKKCIDLYAEQMEFHWGRREYEKVLKVYKQSFDWLSSSNHKKRAIEFEAEWRKRFSEIEGGLQYFEQRSVKHASDAVSTEKLIEQAKLASSAGDLQGEAEAYKKLSNLLKKEDPKLAAESLIKAAMNYFYLNDPDSQLEALEAALVMLFKGGQIVDIMTYDDVLAIADNEAFEEIARLWREIGDMAYAEKMQEEGRMLMEGGQEKALTEAVGRLMCLREKNEYLTVCCIFDLAGFLVKTLSEDAILSLISYISDDYKQEVIDKFDTTMSAEINVDLNYLMKNYFGNKADRLIARYEKYVDVLIELDGANAPALAGNLALIFRRRKEKEKAFRYHGISADLYRSAGKMDDCFIEIMNGATARNELSSVDEAVEILRAGLREAIEKANRKFQAMIAGNLASMLMGKMKEDDRAEIESCFAIEERYFRASGSWRDLVVSLVNQSVYYVRTEAPVQRWRNKVKDARTLATEAKLDEFGTILSQLEWHLARAEGAEESDEESIKSSIRTVMADNGFTLGTFERRESESYYYVVALPQMEDKMYEEAIFGVVPFENNCYVRLIAVIRPILYKEESETLEQYIEWWNKLDKYSLIWDKERKHIKATVDLHAQDWKQMSERVGYFTSLWNADKSNSIALMMGIVSLDDCRQMKLKAME